MQYNPEATTGDKGYRLLSADRTLQRASICNAVKKFLRLVQPLGYYTFRLIYVCTGETTKGKPEHIKSYSKLKGPE